MDVRTVLAAKGSGVETIRPGAPVLLAAQRLRADGIGALVVSSDGRGIEGMLSERDIVVGLAERGDVIARATVSQLMERNVVSCRAGDPIDQVLAQMTRHRRRHIPVVDDQGAVAGIVSIGDLVKHRLDEAELEMRVLRDLSIVRS